MMGVTLASSISWRPLISKPVRAALSPVTYEATMVWDAVTAIPGGNPLPVADLRQTFAFDIVG